MSTTPFLFNATIVYVHDGDTFDVVVDRGTYDYTGSPAHPIPVRILGLNARELAEPGGQEAQANLAGLLPVGSQVVLRTVKPDKYNPRWLAAVTFSLAGVDTDLAALLIGKGWAAPWDGNGPKPVPIWPRSA